MSQGNSDKLGWIALHRKIQDNPLWKEPREFSKAEAWIDLLMEARHDPEPDDVTIGFMTIWCYRGQCVKSLDTWANRWGWSKSKVRRFLTLLKGKRMIDTENVKKTTRITICNYNNYNYQRHENDTPPARDRHADDTQATPDNNGDNVENVDHKKTQQLPLEPPGSTSAEPNSDIGDKVKEIVEQWNTLAKDLQLTTVVKINDKRVKGVNARLKEGIEQYLPQVWQEIRQSQFLQGIKGRESWKGAKFDWIFCSPNYWPKIVEGEYRDKQKTEPEDEPEVAKGLMDNRR